MVKLNHKLFLLFLFSSLFAFSNNGYSQVYDWNEFNPNEFFKAVFICAAIIVVGILINNKSDSKFLKGVGFSIIIIGGIGALIYLSGPIIGAITIIWQVVLGAAIFFGIIYLAYTQSK